MWRGWPRATSRRSGCGTTRAPRSRRAEAEAARARGGGGGGRGAGQGGRPRPRPREAQDRAVTAPRRPRRRWSGRGARGEAQGARPRRGRRGPRPRARPMRCGPRWRRWPAGGPRHGAGGQVLDLLRVAPGYEKALGAALADDLRAPRLEGRGAVGLGALPGPMPARRRCRRARGAGGACDGARGAGRRMGQMGWSTATGAACRRRLKPGQRLVSVEGDLWRWDGFRAGRGCALGGGAAAAAAQPAGGAEARSRGGHARADGARGRMRS
jgi:chromosome segregation protein